MLSELLEIMRDHRDLGWSAQDQLSSLVDGDTDPDSYDLNIIQNYIVPFLEELQNFAADNEIESLSSEIEGLLIETESLIETKKIDSYDTDDGESSPDPDDIS